VFTELEQNMFLVTLLVQWILDWTTLEGME
jgi:hypothetical protein